MKEVSVNRKQTSGNCQVSSANLGAMGMVDRCSSPKVARCVPADWSARLLAAGQCRGRVPADKGTP